jgi:hypothetical protein
MKYRKIFRTRILLLAFLVGQLDNDKGNFVVGEGFTRNDGHSSRPRHQIPQEAARQDQSQAQSSLPPIEAAPRYIAQPRSDSAARRSKYDTQRSIHALLTKARSTSERFAARKSDVAYFINSVHSRIRPGKRTLDAATEKDLFTTTRLSGGAEGDIDNSGAQESERPPSDSQAATPMSRQAFLGNLGWKKPLQGLDIRKKMNDGLQLVQQTGSRVGPSFATIASLLYQSDKGMSFLSLYALALLGSSCGFHLFLYFITVGYALGITIPMTVALYVYNVSIICPFDCLNLCRYC